MNTVYFRVDASAELGEGHLRRCITIAKSLTFNINIVFLCASLTPASKALLVNNSFCTIELETDEYSQITQVIRLIEACIIPPILIIDHYKISKSWEYQVKKATGARLVVIDDLADRPHHCDLLIDSNYFRKSKDYHLLVNSECEVLCGISYVIFSQKVLQSESHLLNAKTVKIKNTTHLFFGATDPHKSTTTIALHLAKLHKQKIYVALTKSTSQLNCQQQQLSNHNDIITNTDESTFSDIMSLCEFAIGAPGISLWERLLLGCKTACFATSENQVVILKHLHEEKICCYLGPIWKMNTQEIERAIQQFYTHGAHLLTFDNFKNKLNGQGCKLIIDKLMSFFPQLQTLSLEKTSLIPYTSEHIKKTVIWLSLPQLRSTFGFSKEISIQSHTDWLHQQHNFYLWAIFNANQYVGNLSIRITPEQQMGYLEIYLGENNTKGQGIGKNSMAMIIEWAFTTMQLKRIELITIEGNLIAEKLYKNSGFVLANIKKRSQLIDDNYVNHHQWILVNK